jgi:hypothetical protein
MIEVPDTDALPKVPLLAVNVSLSPSKSLTFVERSAMAVEPLVPTQLPETLAWATNGGLLGVVKVSEPLVAYPELLLAVIQ